MKVFILGVTGGVGGLLAGNLVSRGDAVTSLVRRADQRVALVPRGVDAHVGDLADLGAHALAALVSGVDAVVFSAGSNGGPAEVTDAVDGAGLATALEACRLAGVRRFFAVSVLPEAWRERRLSADEEHYFSVKKAADIAVSHSALDWVILRPSMLTDGPGTGRVSLSAAEAHDEIPRADVAATLVELLHEPRITRRILELNKGTTPIADAVRSHTC